MRIGTMEFLAFVFYYIVLKAIVQIINVECRRNNLTVPAGVSGLLA